MMKFFMIVIAILGNIDNQIPRIKSNIYSEFKKPSLDNYKEEEDEWQILAGELGEVIDTDSLSVNYGPSKLFDYNLNTTWAINKHLSPKINFKIIFPENTAYEDHSPWIFSGKIILFNGYCKSPMLWSENSRIKELNVYHNNRLLCHVILQDTWHLQYFLLNDFFYDKINNDNRKINLKSGDIISFQITDIYKGSKFEDICLSELYGEMNNGN